MEGKWTKGEWTADGPDCFGDWNIHHPADSLAVAAVVCDPLPGAPTMVAAVVTNLRSAAEVAANARLIAQAPAMAEEVEADRRAFADMAELASTKRLTAPQAKILLAQLAGWASERVSKLDALLTAIKGE